MHATPVQLRVRLPNLRTFLLEKDAKVHSYSIMLAVRFEQLPTGAMSVPIFNGVSAQVGAAPSRERESADVKRCSSPVVHPSVGGLRVARPHWQLIPRTDIARSDETDPDLPATKVVAVNRLGKVAINPHQHWNPAPVSTSVRPGQWTWITIVR